MEDTYFRDPVPLTRKETALREQLEAKIFSTVRSFYLELGAVLAEIQEKRLYKSTHQTFGDYSAEVLDMASRRAYQYIEAHGVVRNLQAITGGDEDDFVNHGTQNTTQPLEITLPQNERQARALVGLEPDEQRNAWFEAVETADGRITAAHVRKTVRELGLEKITKTVEKVKRAKAKNSSRMSDDFEKAFNAFLDAVNVESVSAWKTTDRLTVVKRLDIIRNVISENGSHRVPGQGYVVEATNIEKLQAAGFVLYRSDKKRLLIERHDPDIGWMVVDTYADIPAMEDAFDGLMRSLTNLRG